MIFAMESLRDRIGKNFNKLVKERPELTVPMIAEAAEVTRGMVYKWIDRVNIPDPDKIDKLASLFRVDVLEFYKGESNVVTLYGQSPLRSYLVIPDEVVELAARVPVDFDWGGVLAALEAGSPSKKGEKQA